MSSKGQKADERKANRWRKHHAVLAALVLSEDDELGQLASELGHAVVDERRLRLARTLAQTVLEGLLSDRGEDWAPIEVAMAAARAVRPERQTTKLPAVSGIRPAGRGVGADGDRGSPHGGDVTERPSDSAESQETRAFKHLRPSSVALYDAATSSHVGAPASSPRSEPPSTDPAPTPWGRPVPLPAESPWVGPPAHTEPTPSSTITETTLPAVEPPPIVPLEPVRQPPATRPDRRTSPARPRPYPVPPSPAPVPGEPAPLWPAPAKPPRPPVRPPSPSSEPTPLSPTLPSHAPPTPHGTPAPRPPHVIPLRPVEPTPLPELQPLRPAAHLLDDTATEAAALPMPVERYAALTAMSEHAYREQQNRILTAFGMSPGVDRRRLDAVYADTFRRRPSLRERFGQALHQWRAMLASRRKHR